MITKLRQVTAYQFKLFVAHLCIFTPAVLVLSLKIYNVFFK